MRACDSVADGSLSVICRIGARGAGARLQRDAEVRPTTGQDVRRPGRPGVRAVHPEHVVSGDVVDALGRRDVRLLDLIARDVYGADGVSYSDTALAKAKALEADPENHKMSTCMVKTHLSLSHDPALKGRPRGFILPIRDFLIFKGAGFIAPVAGDIKLLPGTASNPAYRNIDVDVDSGQVRGLF